MCLLIAGHAGYSRIYYDAGFLYSAFFTKLVLIQF